MSYEKQTWETGQVITAEKLNHMEDGIANGGVLVVHKSSGGTLDKTWEEIVEAPLAVIHGGEEALGFFDVVTKYGVDENVYKLLTFSNDEYDATNLDTYPQIVNGDDSSVL